MNINWKRKLSSRKFWAAVSGVVISVMIAVAEGSTDKAAIKKENETKE